MITLGALELGTLLSGAVLTEQVFTIPGFGKLIVDAVFNRDYAVVQGVVLFTATAYIVLNLAADIAYVVVNPQIRAHDGDVADALPCPRRRRARAAPRAASVPPTAAPARRRGRPRGDRLLRRRSRCSRRGSRPTTRSRPAGRAIRKAPSAAHWFGTDEIGRDVLSRVIWGARASLLAGVVSVLISLSIGVPIGLLAGYAGGRTDMLISRLTDAVLACPFLILAIALAAFLGPSLTNAMIAIGVSATPVFVRLTRGRRWRSRRRSSSSRRARSAIRPGASRCVTCCRTSCPR